MCDSQDDQSFVSTCASLTPGLGKKLPGGLQRVQPHMPSLMYLG